MTVQFSTTCPNMLLLHWGFLIFNQPLVLHREHRLTPGHQVLQEPGSSSNPDKRVYLEGHWQYTFPASSTKASDGFTAIIMNDRSPRLVYGRLLIPNGMLNLRRKCAQREFIIKFEG